MAARLVIGCGSDGSGDRPYLLQGAWTLRQIDYPIGHTETLTEVEGTELRLYDGDSVFHQCWMTRTESGLMVRPQVQFPVMLIDKGYGDYFYQEDDNPRPLAVVDDTTIVIQQNGIRYTWHRADDIADEWDSEIKGAFAVAETQDVETDVKLSYMLSTKERRQASFIHWLWAAIAVIAAIAGAVYVTGRRRRQQLQLQLQQIQETLAGRPQEVQQAIESVETDFFSSAEYQALLRRIATGQRLKDDEWTGVERQVRKVYPGFSSQLHNLYDMSELEYHVSLLVNLRAAPSAIAAVLARDVSTISTVRSRLYRKVFGRKGGAREWDDFILSIGA